ncbi:MAG: hypothetical protein Q8R83_03400 [Legionellaceae bacterium]|nr:hypothetical protein [Legionellaceae bacterium]
MISSLQELYDALNNIISIYYEHNLNFKTIIELPKPPPAEIADFHTFDTKVLSIEEQVKHLTETKSKRATLFNYIFYTQQLIKPHLLTSDFLGEPVYEALKNDLALLITNLNRLEATSENIEIDITQGKEQIKIIGFLNKLSNGGGISYSGQLIKDKLLNQLVPNFIQNIQEQITVLEKKGLLNKIEMQEARIRDLESNQSPSMIGNKTALNRMLFWNRNIANSLGVQQSPEGKGGEDESDTQTIKIPKVKIRSVETQTDEFSTNECTPS